MTTATKTKRINKSETAKICEEIQTICRNRNCNLKSRIMLENRLLTSLAVSAFDYSSGLKEEDRQTRLDQARALMKQIEDGEIESDFQGLVLSSREAINGFDAMVEMIDKELIKLAKQLPVAKWVQRPQQAGFGVKSLGVVIGETGDLANYNAPGKLWKRMGLAPFEFKGQRYAGSSFRQGRVRGLSNEQWTELGYAPQRRAVMYVIGENLIKLNHDAYRRRYDEAKEKALKRPDWSECQTCEGWGDVKGRKCSMCKGSGKYKMHAHKHAMLLATKLLLKNLWMEWNPELARHTWWVKNN